MPPLLLVLIPPLLLVVPLLLAVPPLLPLPLLAAVPLLLVVAPLLLLLPQTEPLVSHPSPLATVKLSLQSVKPLWQTIAQLEPLHVRDVFAPPEGQTFPHIPQLSTSMTGVHGLPLHDWNPDLHTDLHVPDEQSGSAFGSVVVQGAPQPPQFVSVLKVCKHWLPQTV